MGGNLAISESGREEELRQIAENGGGWPAPNAADLEQERELSVEQARWLAERFVGHPGRTVYEPAILKRPLAQQTATYIACTMCGHSTSEDAAAMRGEPSSTFRELVAVHWPIVSAPMRSSRCPTRSRPNTAYRDVAEKEAFVNMDDFTTAEIQTDETSIFVRSHGSGPPVLLLHGFPQTHLMWRIVAPLLARNFTVVCADLRGYGRSGCPVSAPDHAPYAKRSMARDMVTVMEQLGFPRFAVAGHDRGGRVAYRLALDHPDRIDRLAVLDIVPTETVWERADARFALAYWPWSLLAQPEPLPERILMAAAEAIVDDALGGWGSPAAVFPPQVRAAYVQALRDPGHAHAICEEYRAAATIDREHDTADRASGRRIVCPLLVLWSAQGPLDTWYVEEAGPIALWRVWSDDVQGRALNGGHFFPEEAPEQTADALNRFFGAAPSPHGLTNNLTRV